MGKKNSWCELFCTLKKTHAFGYPDSPTVGSNRCDNSVYKTSDSFEKNQENCDAGQLLSAASGRDELHYKINQLVASQNTVKDSKELNDKMINFRGI